MTRENAIRAYNRASATSLREVYGRFSWYKEQAFNRCIRRMVELDGRCGKITSATSQFFSYAFIYTKGEKDFLCYITYANEYHFQLD